MHFSKSIRAFGFRIRNAGCLTGTKYLATGNGQRARPDRKKQGLEDPGGGKRFSSTTNRLNRKVVVLSRGPKHVTIGARSSAEERRNEIRSRDRTRSVPSMKCTRFVALEKPEPSALASTQFQEGQVARWTTSRTGRRENHRIKKLMKIEATPDQQPSKGAGLASKKKKGPVRSSLKREGGEGGGGGGEKEIVSGVKPTKLTGP